MKKLFAAVLAGCLLLAACGQLSEKHREREDIEKALKSYIDQQPGFGPEIGDRSVRVYNVDRDRAEVVVEFKSRTDSTVRLMLYHLRRESGTWVVKESRPYTPRPD